MTTHDISLTVNGTDERLTVESRTLLVHALRDRLGYTGPNVGCETGKCGACTVHLDGDAVKSCTVLAVQADGGDVTTAAGLADDGDLHPLQTAFHEEHGLQCGYCTPGMVMTAADLLEVGPASETEGASVATSTPRSDDDSIADRDGIRTALKGNICRCTGYQNVVDAVETAADELRDADSSTDGPTEPSAGPAEPPGGER